MSDQQDERPDEQPEALPDEPVTITCSGGITARPASAGVRGGN